MKRPFTNKFLHQNKRVCFKQNHRIIVKDDSIRLFCGYEKEYGCKTKIHVYPSMQHSII